MYQIDSRKINRHPNIASVREWYETTKPWRGRGEDRPFGGRKQRWCVLRKDGEDYVVLAWNQEVLRYRPDGYITITMPHDNGARALINRALPWVCAWGCGTSWLMVNPEVVKTYPHFGGVYSAGVYDEPKSQPVVVAVHETRRTVTLRAFTPSDPLFAMETLFENRERDLVSIPMIRANRAARKAAYKEYDLDTFATWARAYLQMSVKGAVPQYHYQSRWTARREMPSSNLWLHLLRDRDSWMTLVGNVDVTYTPSARAESTVTMLRHKILTTLGAAGIEATHYQQLPYKIAYLAYDQRRRTMRDLGLSIDSIPYADAHPQPTVVTTVTTTTPEATV